MATIAVFPGQGSQKLGMGKEIADNFKPAKLVFDEVDEALGDNLFKIMSSDDEAALKLTRNAQPALMANSIAILRVLEDVSGKKANNIFNFFAGHSLGEYTSLVASNSMKLSDAACLLRLRGDAMQSAVPVGQGAMTALIGVSIEEVERFINLSGDLNGIVEIANDNAPGQVVISGNINEVNKVSKIAKDSGAKAAINLQVSAPFHCSLMEPAKKIMKDALNDIEFKEPKLPVISNVSAIPETAPNILKENLISQITKKVRWRETMLNLDRLGVNGLLEIGSGSVLKGLARTCLSGQKCDSIENINQINIWVENSLN